VKATLPSEAVTCEGGLRKDQDVIEEIRGSEECSVGDCDCYVVIRSVGCGDSAVRGIGKLRLIGNPTRPKSRPSHKTLR